MDVIIWSSFEEIKSQSATVWAMYWFVLSCRLLTECEAILWRRCRPSFRLFTDCEACNFFCL